MRDESELALWIEVNEGVKPDNASKVLEAETNAIVAGTAIFELEDYAATISALRHSKQSNQISVKSCK